MNETQTTVPAVSMQVAVETMLFLDAAEQLQLRPWQIVSCDWFEDAMREGYRSIAEREDLAELAEKGLGLDDVGYAQWLEQSERAMDSASKLFSLATCIIQKRPLSNEAIQIDALRMAEFYACYSASDNDAPAFAAQIRQTFEAVLREVQKIMPDARIQKVTLAPSSTTLQ